MKFSVSKEIITPCEQVFLSGFEVRSKKCSGVHDDIHASVVLMQSSKTVVFIALDLTTGDRSFVDGIKGEIYNRFGIKGDEVLINFSHSHSSIAVTGDDPLKRQGVEMYYSISHVPRICFVPDSDMDYSVDLEYYYFLKKKLLDMIEQCFDNLEEGELHLGRGESAIGVNRRRMTPEGVKFAPDFNKAIDNDLFVLALMNREEKMKAILFCYGCHPSGLSSDQMSADFPGYACKYLQEHYPEAEAVFLQGCAGDVKPRRSSNDTGDGFKGYSFEDCIQTGRELAEDVISIINGNRMAEIDVNISTCMVEPRLYAEISNIQVLETRREKGMKGEDWLMAESCERRLTQTINAIKSGKPKNSVPCYISIWSLGSGVNIIGIEGEVVSGLGTRIKKLINSDKIIVMGYTNGIQCYINTREVLKEGGYEADSFAELNLSGPLVPETEDIIIGQICKSGCVLKEGK